jgi:L-seryl-tRNA(Ser) seleniumtransferase
MTSLERSGARPIINACGIYTDLGGSRLSPTVWAAMTDANQSFVRMVDLLESSGRIIAQRLGAEAGLVTTGAAASITLMVSAAMTGTDGAAGERLPDTTGLKNEIVLQRNHHYKYDRQIRMTGATIVRPGTDAGTTAAELEAAIGPRTAALFVPAHLDGAAGTVPFAEVVAIGRRRGVPVMVDAAYMCWPLDAFPSYLAAGADLVCASAKYFLGPNAGGFIVGTRRMVDAVVTNNFTRYESGQFRTFGRPYKLDRQTVVGVVTAFEEWISMDHAARWARLARHAAELESSLVDLTGVRVHQGYFTMDERIIPEPVNALVVEIDPETGTNAAAVGKALGDGDPSIAAVVEPDRLIFCFDVTADSEIPAIAGRLRQILGR